MNFLDSLEEQTRNLEKGAQTNDALAVWRRDIHTIKGESGMLALDDVCAMCNAIEEALEGDLTHKHLPGFTIHSIGCARALVRRILITRC